MSSLLHGKFEDSANSNVLHIVTIKQVNRLQYQGYTVESDGGRYTEIQTRTAITRDSFI